MNKSRLTSREWDIPGSWYAPRGFLGEFPSVKFVELTDTCSSSGDWSGYFCQQIGKTSYVIPFGQTNNWPNGGYTLYTSNEFAQTKAILTRQEFMQIIEDIESINRSN